MVVVVVFLFFVCLFFSVVVVHHGGRPDRAAGPAVNWSKRSIGRRRGRRCSRRACVPWAAAATAAATVWRLNIKRRQAG